MPDYLKRALARMTRVAYSHQSRAARSVAVCFPPSPALAGCAPEGEWSRGR
jgi:hypothetical protein